MSDTGEKSSGGFNIGNVGGNFNLSAGGDIVGRDKITTTTTTKGFADNGQKEQFQAQIDQLRETLRAIKAEITANAKLDADQKDAIEAEISQRLVALKDAKDQAAAAPVGKEPPADVVAKVGGALDRAGGVMDKLNTFAEKSEAIAETVSKYWPLLLSARHLFGLP